MNMFRKFISLSLLSLFTAGILNVSASMVAEEEAMDSSVQGIWYNELGSIMTINNVEQDTIIGTYNSNVGEAEYDYPLIGKFDALSSASDRKAIGFVVFWNNESTGNSQSITTWSGRYNADDQQIYTSWLLTNAKGAEWSSTNIGQDVFIRTKPSIEDIQNKLKHGSCSHPMR